MAPTIDIVCSAHAIKDHEDRADVSSLGRDQCCQLVKNYPYRSQVKHVVSSPLTRAIQTGIYCFLHPETTGFPMLLLSELQETSAGPSDTGAPLSKLQHEFGKTIDTSALGGEKWYRKDRDTAWFPSWKKVEERACQARLRLRDLAQKLGDNDRIVVVTHGFFANFLVQEFAGLTPVCATGHWRHAQFRSFQFADLQGHDDLARLKEMKENLESREIAVPGANSPSESACAWQRILAVDFLRRQEEGAVRSMPGTAASVQ